MAKYSISILGENCGVSISGIGICKLINNTTMNENLDLTKILAGCPKGTPLYSTIHGNATLAESDNGGKNFPIEINFLDEDGEIGRAHYTRDGRYFALKGAECVLFPSKEQRDWAQFKQPQQKFMPFDKVIVCDGVDDNWMCSLFSHYDIVNKKYTHVTLNGCYVYCLPFEGNEHLVGQQFKEEHLK